LRIASLLPSATEIACFLGLEDRLVGVSHECDFPVSVRALPQLTDSIIPHGLSQAEIDARVTAAVREGKALYTVNGTLLADLAPGLIVTQGLCDVCAVSEATVAEAMDGIPCDVSEGATVISLGGTSFEGVMDDIRRLGAAAGVAEVAEARCQELRQRWAAVPRAPGAPRVALLEWPDPAFTGGHWVPEQIERAGGTDVLGAVGVDSKRIPWEEVVAAEPDLIGVIACGYGVEDNAAFARQLYARPELAGLSALRQGRVFAFDANSFFSRPAPRLVRGAELLSHVLRDGGDLPGEVVRVASA